MRAIYIPALAASCLATASPAARPQDAQTEPRVLEAVETTAEIEATGKDSLRATTTSIGKGTQDLHDVPQSVAIVTERLMDDRNLHTLQETLKQTGGVTFLAAEGGEEDIRLRGFSLQGSGDIFINGMRDPAFYDRDSFNWDRLEVLRGSASMLFGRGSTGGAVNQVSKQPSLRNHREIALTGGEGEFLRTVADLSFATTDHSALRVNAMYNHADNYGNTVDKQGIAPAFRWGIGTPDDFTVSVYHLQNDNGIHYGLPWLTPGAAQGGDYLWDRKPSNYYGMQSDTLGGGTTQGNLVHVHRFNDDRELRTALRVARYERDQRASAIRFAAANLQPGGLAVTSDNFGDTTVLTRGTNLKIMDMDTQYAQTDYSGRHVLRGREHSIQAGADVAHEAFENFGATLPTGVTLTKARTTVGTPDDGAVVDESLRVLAVNRDFDARAVGLYAQDLMQLGATVKLLAGLRWDNFEGEYRNIAVPANTGNACSVQPASRISRSDSLFSKRLGLLYQPSHLTSVHLSYGTSFNTSGDAYQYDAGTANVAPEKSRNLELGAKFDSWSGNFSSRFGVFHSTKYNERNRDADTVNACNYVLSGERHVAGLEADFAGRIAHRWELYASYSFIPVARVDESSGAAGTEPVGSRPGLTPKHSGTIWSTFEVSPRWRLGAGLNARSKDKPAGLAVNSPLRAPAFATFDLMAEFQRETFAVKANLSNIADAHYAETVYRGHYVPGRGRTLEVTATVTF